MTKFVTAAGVIWAALSLTPLAVSYSLSPELPVQADRVDSIFVGLHEQAIVKLDDGLVQYGLRARSLKTAGLATCVGVIFYDPVTKTGALAHLDNDLFFSPKDALHELLSRFNAVAGTPPKERVHTYIASNFEAPELYREVARTLGSWGFTLNEVKGDGDRTSAVNISLDLASGQVSQFKLDRSLYVAENIPADMRRVKSQIDGHLRTVTPCELSLLQKTQPL